MAGYVHSDSKHGQLTINSVNLMGPAWRIMNMAELWSRTARGSSVAIPAVAGRKSRNRRTDEIVYGLVLEVSGFCSSAGVPSSTPLAQLAANMIALEAVAINPSGNTGHGATWKLPNGSTRTANVWVQRWDVTDVESAPYNRVSFDLVVPAGGWS